MRTLALGGLLLAFLGGARAMESGAALALPPRNVEAAARYSDATGGRALIIQQFGRPVHRSFARGGGEHRAEWVMSITKSLAALAVLAAEADGLLSLEESAAKTLPEWRDGRRKITIRELLAQTSGLAPGFDSLYGPRGRADKTRVALALPLVTAPGTRFDYGPGNYEVLAEILRRKLKPRGQDPLDYLQTRVLSPIGVRPADWRRDRTGRPFFSAGARLTAADLVRIGEFLGRGGRVWIVPVLPGRAVTAAMTGSAANAMYGLGFWLNARAPVAAPLAIEATLGADRSPAAWRDACLSPAAPADLFALVGSGGQRVYVVPSRRIVVVRLGTGGRFRDDEFLDRLFARP